MRYTRAMGEVVERRRNHDRYGVPEAWLDQLLRAHSEFQDRTARLPPVTPARRSYIRWRRAQDEALLRSARHAADWFSALEIIKKTGASHGGAAG